MKSLYLVIADGSNVARSSVIAERQSRGEASILAAQTARDYVGRTCYVAKIVESYKAEALHHEVWDAEEDS